MNSVLKENLNKIIVLFIIVIAFVISLAIMLKYKTEGETNMPWILNKILIVSSADASNNSENTENHKWNLNINQYNDIYFYIGKNDNYKKNTFITSVTIENINIKQPQKGNITLYRPSNLESKVFSYDEEFLIKDSVTFNGAKSDDAKNLEINNSGGMISFRVLNKDISKYISDDDDEIHYDGSLLEKTGVAVEEISAELNFDLVIKTNKSTYRGNFTIQVPNENLEKEGVSQKTINDFSNIIFKRERSK